MRSRLPLALRALTGFSAVICLSGCVSDAEAISFDGRELMRPEIDAPRKADLEQKLAAAQAAYDLAPDSVEATVWLGRRTAYLGRYREAIDIYTEGLENHPRNARLLRHRGHRHLTIRRPDLAVEDFEAAARAIRGVDDVVEQDGLPNAAGIPTTSLQFNIWYHLGLAYFLQEEWSLALGAYRECEQVALLPDAVVAVRYWLCLTLARLGGEEQWAQIDALLADLPEDGDLYENLDYLRLLRLFRSADNAGPLLEQLSGGSEDSVSSATVQFGLANYWRYFDRSLGGDRDRSEGYVEICRSLVEGPGWAAFGYLAAEASLVAEDEL